MNELSFLITASLLVVAIIFYNIGYKTRKRQEEMKNEIQVEYFGTLAACPECGTRILYEFRYCGFCGKKIKWIGKK